MRLVKVRRRSTAYYKRHRPPDADWTSHPQPTAIANASADASSQQAINREARQLNLLYERSEQLHIDNEYWLRRTMARLTSTVEENEAAKSSGKTVEAVSSCHQLRQQERDRLIQERRERGRRLMRWQQRPPLQGSENDDLGPNQGEGQLNSSRSQADSKLSSATAADETTTDSEGRVLLVKSLMAKPRKDQRAAAKVCQHIQDNHGNRNVNKRHSKHRQHARSDKLPPLPPPPLPQRPSIVERQAQLVGTVPTQQSRNLHQRRPFQSMLALQSRPRRLGSNRETGGAAHSEPGLEGPQQRRDPQRLQYLSIAAPAADVAAQQERQSTELANYLTPRGHRPTQSGESAAIDNSRQLLRQQFDSELTLVQPRNPVNSPELML